jgi:hypothetical protein
VIQRIVRQNFGKFRKCYEAGLKSDPSLSGRVTVRFVITRTGTVSSVSGSGDIPDTSVISCVTRAFYGLSFPQPEGGIVTVSYPIVFTPSGESASPKPDSGPGLGPTGPSLGPPTNTCTARRKEGEACRAARECAADLGCVDGKCAERAGEGSRCRADSECKAGLACLLEPPKDEPTAGEGEEEAEPQPRHHMCRKPASAGETCGVDAECAGVCVSGKCAAFCGSD